MVNCVYQLGYQLTCIRALGMELVVAIENGGGGACHTSITVVRPLWRGIDF